MIYSMTGFGRGECIVDDIAHVVEIKSVNSKFAEVRVRLPHGLHFLEVRIVQYVKSRISRGRIDVSILRSSSVPAGSKVIFNHDIAGQYIQALKKLQEEFSIISDVSLDALLQAEGVFELSMEELDADAVWQQLLPGIEQAMDSLVRMRASEAGNILQDITQRIEKLKDLSAQIEQIAAGFSKEYFQRLKERMTELLSGTGAEIDEDRLYAELALIADRSDITEELVRFASHISQFEKYVSNESSPIGRRLDFLIQEMNREMNTIASKLQTSGIAPLVVETKAELEKIREQVQNIE